MSIDLPEINTPLGDGLWDGAKQAWQAQIHAFVEMVDVPDHETLPTTDGKLGALGGVTLGIKDVVDVVGYPTRNGSETCRDVKPAAKDAQVVAALRQAGAVVVGKTVTTEFAFTDPTNCRNPYDLQRSPGGSSSGSGAAVAAGMVDVALGTQTAGSLCRPAAYCGVVGFKPTYSVLSTTGMTPLSRSFDTVGIIARSVGLVQRVHDAVGPDEQCLFQFDEMVAVAALLPTAVTPTSEVAGVYKNASLAMAEMSFQSRTAVIAADIDSIVADHRTVMNFEAAAEHGHYLNDERADVLGSKFRAGLQAGVATSADQARAAMHRLQQAKRAFWDQQADVDVILTLAVPDGAPLMDGTTGYQDWLTPWTVFGGPLICLPWGLDTLGRPLSVMLAAQPGQDAKLLAIAAGLEQAAPSMPRPRLPTV